VNDCRKASKDAKSDLLWRIGPYTNYSMTTKQYNVQLNTESLCPMHLYTLQ